MNAERKKVQEERTKLKNKIKKSQEAIRSILKIKGNLSEARTDLANIKFPATTVDEERDILLAPLSAEIECWRKILPGLVADFEKIKDPRNPNSIKHSITVIMIYGLLLFLFRMGSRKELNLELNRPKFLENIKSIFPELNSKPHADTIARLLDGIDPETIEKATAKMMKKLLDNDTFYDLLIMGKLPISIDGVEKIKRNGGLLDVNWLERNIGKKESKDIQQYVYIVEANITFPNGLTIPLMSEFLEFDKNPDMTKQDCEILGFKRLAARLKEYFQTQNIIICLDKLYACEPVLEIVNNNSWAYMIVLPTNKLKSINNQLNTAKKTQETQIDGQPMYNGREQYFSLAKGLEYKSISGITAVSCLEKYQVADNENGESITKYSEHRWITNLKVTPSKLHLLFNLCARKRWMIEDSNNTEKNRGYNYKHAYSYDWNSMKCFHYLMRLAHAINALSEYTPRLKKVIKKFGWSRTLKWARDVLWTPWVTVEWVQNELEKPYNFKIEY